MTVEDKIDKEYEWYKKYEKEIFNNSKNRFKYLVIKDNKILRRFELNYAVKKQILEKCLIQQCYPSEKKPVNIVLSAI